MKHKNRRNEPRGEVNILRTTVQFLFKSLKPPFENSECIFNMISRCTQLSVQSSYIGICITLCDLVGGDYVPGIRICRVCKDECGDLLLNQGVCIDCAS